MIESRAPGRVNLIGEHTDYSGGFVMPCAIRYETRVTAAPLTDPIVTAESSAGGLIVLRLDGLSQRRGDWGDYVRGILIELHRAGVPLQGAALRITGDVPLGAGLSSSASLEIAVALAILRMTRAALDDAALAKLAQRAENDHVGTRCGIMDQFAVLRGREGCAMFLDTRSLDAQQLPIPAETAIVICNTMVRHELSTGAYNDRRRECEEAAALLGVPMLRDATLEMLEDGRRRLAPALYKRARHVVTENARVAAAAKALRERDARRFGELMNASHESLRMDYEVSCGELDTMVRLARAHEGVYGARMTGGGFGGCTVNLVDRDRADAFRSHIVAAYRAETGITPDLYDGTPSRGAEILHE